MTIDNLIKDLQEWKEKGCTEVKGTLYVKNKDSNNGAVLEVEDSYWCYYHEIWF